MFTVSMTAIHKHCFRRPVPNQSYIQEISFHACIFLTVVLF